MTITSGDPRTAAGPRTSWTGLHCYLQATPDDVDALLREAVAPELARLRADGDVGDWFLVRYADDGMHLRIRVRDIGEPTVAALTGHLRAAVGTLTPHGPGRHGDVLAVTYEPETERYGGSSALPVAEELFCRSTDLALALLSARPSRGALLTVVLDLWAATAGALGLDGEDAVRWLRTTALMWRLSRVDGLLPGWVVQRSAQEAALVQGPAVARRFTAVSAAARAEATGPTPTGLEEVLQWAELVRDARRSLEPPGPCRSRWLGVWASQVHMFCNRLGVLPDEERATAALAAESLLSPTGPAPFFDDGAPGRTTAADRRYLWDSRFVAASMTQQNPRSTPPPQRLRTPFPPPGPVHRLPAPAPLPPGLADALDRRASARGDLGGRLSATDVATLLGGAAASRPAGPGAARRWPHPAAGGRYVARLRLAARAVEGLPAAVYDVDDEQGEPVLRPLGPPPSTEELVAASMWFTDGGAVDGGGPDGGGVTVPAGRIDAATVPAVLGLYLRTDVLRDAYGLRALRFGLLEAGHLAQDLALVAAAAGLALTTVGGFYDDTAHELFLLDGVDDVLTYLLPLGRLPSEGTR